MEYKTLLSKITAKMASEFGENLQVFTNTKGFKVFKYNTDGGRSTVLKGFDSLNNPVNTIKRTQTTELWSSTKKNHSTGEYSITYPKPLTGKMKV